MPDPAYVYFSWQGRISRKTYWFFGLLPAAIYVVYIYVLPDITVWFDVLFFVAIVMPSTMINIKRSHDRGRTGWFTLVLLVPIVSLWPLVEFGFLEGTTGPNRFGEPAIW